MPGKNSFYLKPEIERALKAKIASPVNAICLFVSVYMNFSKFML